jgi:hypothetical protein
MSILIQENFKLGVRYKFTERKTISNNDNHDNSIYSEVLHNIQNDKNEHRLIFINIQNKSTLQSSYLYSVPVSSVKVYVQSIPQLPGFLNLEISKNKF